MMRTALAFSVLLGLAGCAASVAPPPVAPAPVAACLTLVVRDERQLQNVYDRDVQKAVRGSFEEAMTGAGFNVLADPALPHDLVARLSIEPGSRVESGAKVRAKLTLERGSQVVDTLEVSAAQEGPGYDGAVADQLVDAIFRSAPLAAFTKGLRSAKSKDHLAAGALRVALASAAPAPCPVAPPPAASAEPAPPAPAATPGVPSPYFAGTAQPSAFAFIVGVEEYARAPRVPGGRADAERFAELARRTLGVPEGHLKLIVGEKADKLAFDLTAEWLKLNVPTGGRVYFYFAGQGASSRGTSFLLPHDGDPRALDRTAVSLPAFLQVLSQTRAHDVLAIVDAGFSGAGGRSAPGEGKPPATIGEPKVPAHVALLSAVTGAEIAGSSADGAGLLTRFLIEGVGQARADFDGDGRISLQELLAWAGPRVTRQAHREQRVQTPIVLLGPGMGSTGFLHVASGLPLQ